MEAKWTTQKYSLLSVHLAKLNKVLTLMKKERQVYNLNIFSQQTQKQKKKA